MLIKLHLGNRKSVCTEIKYSTRGYIEMISISSGNNSSVGNKPRNSHKTREQIKLEKETNCKFLIAQRKTINRLGLALPARQ